MRVLQIARRFVRHDWGGTETVVLETSKRLLERGAETEVVCPNALADQDAEIVRGVPIRRFGYFYPYLGLNRQAKQQLDKKAGNLFSFSLMRYLKRASSVDLLHLHTGKRLGGIARYIAQKRQIPYVVSLHGGLLDVPSEESKQWVAPTRGTIEWGKVLGWWVGSRKVLHDAGAILCVGAGEYQAVSREFPNQRVVQLPNGVDVNRFKSGDGDSFRRKHGIESDAKVILCMGRIDPQKNQLALIRAMPQCQERDPKTHLLLVGHVTNPEYEERLLAEIRRLGIHRDVTIVRGIDPASRDVCNAYHAADLFVLPSIHEPFGIVVVEAWAAGCPVIASNVGGLRGLVDDGVNGHLFDPVNENSCAEAILRWMDSDSEESNRIVKAARRTAEEKYSWDRVTDQLMEIYEEVINDSNDRK